MNLEMLKSKIHRATVTEASLNYVGSITLDSDLLDASGILPYEKVLVVDVEAGTRLETYTIPGQAGSGIVCLNGPAARLVQIGDHVVIMSFCSLSQEEAKDHKPKVVFVDQNNQVSSINHYEKHGLYGDDK